MKKHGYRLTVGLVAAALLNGAGWGTAAQASEWSGGAKDYQVYASSATVSSDGRYADYSSGAIPKAIQQTSPSVVAIIGKQADDEGRAGRFDLSHGTGVIVGSNGTIITNAHVVKDMEHIVVVTYDGKQYNGKTTHMDEESDLALVRIEATGLKEAVFASKSDMQVGETVIAIGTPISFSLRNSVTVGVISGLDRSVSSTYRLLQTDAAINPGNSGGALVNLKGEVVGINTLKYADYGIDNLGFAIPADTVQYVLKHFTSYGKVKRPYVGMELEETWAAVVGIPTEEPLTVGFVEPESPAAKAGIKSGDKLLTVSGETIRTLVEFNELLKRYLPGDKAVFTLQSEGKTVTRTVQFGEVEETGGGLQSAVSGDDEGFDSDAGKTRVGNSQYGWSMKYPSGVEQYDPSPKGNSVTLGDAKGEYSLHVRVEEKRGEYSKSALLKTLAEQEGGATILERRYVEGKNDSYAKVISKDEDGYYESRAYSNGDYVYYVSLSIYEEKDFKSSIKRKGYTDLLDSFSFGFDAKDPALKDIAVQKEGYHRYTHEDYGYSFSVPTGWKTASYGDQSRYTDKDGTSHVEVVMASMADGDSLEAWANRTAERLVDRYVAEYIESGEITDTEAAGLPAKEWAASTSLGDKWNTIRYVFLESKGYKYRIEIGYPKDKPEEEVEELVSKVKASFELNGDFRNEYVGYMEDDEDLVDYGNTVSIANKSFGYTIKVPEFWEQVDYSYYGMDDDEGGEFMSFRFLGGTFSIVADREDSFEDAVEDTEAYHKKNKETDSDYKYVETDESLFGVAAQKFVLHYEAKNIPYEQTQYIFRKNDTNYLVSLSLYDATRTESNVQDMQEAFRSLRFKTEK